MQGLGRDSNTTNRPGIVYTTLVHVCDAGTIYTLFFLFFTSFET